MNMEMFFNDTDCDGLGTLACFANTYDEHGNLLTSDTDNGCNGALDEDCWVFSYNEQGNIQTYTEDDDCNGTPNDCYTYTYDCP